MSKRPKNSNPQEKTDPIKDEKPTSEVKETDEAGDGEGLGDINGALVLQFLFTALLFPEELRLRELMQHVSLDPKNIDRWGRVLNGRFQRASQNLGTDYFSYLESIPALLVAFSRALNPDPPANR